MKSVIWLSEKIENLKRRFGSQLYYYPCKIVFSNGKELNALFTRNQLKIAVQRSNKNLEDLDNSKELIKEYLGM